MIALSAAPRLTIRETIIKKVVIAWLQAIFVLEVGIRSLIDSQEQCYSTVRVRAVECESAPDVAVTVRV